ncbi:MAG: M48 family metallopeptidase [Bacteroidetes bacterium]|nr:M48 family metallopeptidase [Bacteroidota bacterium]
MRSKNKLLLIAMVAVVLLINCSRVPITGRRQMNMLPESSLIDMSLTNYNEFLSQNKVVKNSADAKMVKKVGVRISKAVERYMKKSGNWKRIKDYKWEFNLINQDVANAWAMPGGKVVFYTGILPFTKTEAGLAVVMGHEIAHAIARHGNERMSQGLLTTLGGIGLAIAVNNKPQETQVLFMAAYGVGAQVGMMLPFSRKHESEADKMGLAFMAMAGYDPEEAPRFWQRMSKGSSKQPAEFLSTHPSNKKRIEDLKRFIPIAKSYKDKYGSN